MATPTQLKEELKTYKKAKNQLLKEAKGQFVLIKGDKILEKFNNFDDALQEGYKQFGNKPFLVKQITDVEEVNYFSRPII